MLPLGGIHSHRFHKIQPFDLQAMQGEMVADLQKESCPTAVFKMHDETIKGTSHEM